MKKQSFIFLGIFLILIAGCAHTQSTPNSTPSIEGAKEELPTIKKEIEIIKQSVERLEETVKDSTSTISALGTNIDSLRNDLQENTKQNISIEERRLSKVEEKFDKAKELEKEVDQIRSAIDRNLNYGINITVLIITVLALVISIIGICLLGYLRMKVKEFKTDIKGSLAIAKNSNAVGFFYKNRIEEAIKEGDMALKYALEAHGKNPTEPDKKTFLFVLKSNLAYYWVAGNKVDNKEIALQYAEEGLKIGKIAFVDNFLYIFMKLAKTKKEEDRWKEIYLAYKTDIENYYRPSPPQIPSLSEMEQYEEFYRQIERE